MMNLLLSYLVAKIDIEIQSGLEPGSSKWREIPPCFDFYVVICSYSSRPFLCSLDRYIPSMYPLLQWQSSRQYSRTMQYIKNNEIQSEFEPGSSEWRSDALTN